MKVTNVLTKLLISIVNVAVTFVIALPFLIYYGVSVEWKFFWIAIFFIYNLAVEILLEKCVGMMLFKARYETLKPLWQRILFAALYTASFSTLLFYIWFPFDILLINLVVIQLPCVLSTGTTAHGLLSGKIKTVRGS